MQIKSITLLKGYHITATERKSIITMINSGMVSASNRPDTKRYEIVRGTPVGENYIYMVQVSSKATWDIGGKPEWRKELITIKTK